MVKLSTHWANGSVNGLVGFIPFPKVLALHERQATSSKIWTRGTVSIFYDNNHKCVCVCMCVYERLSLFLQTLAQLSWKLVYKSASSGGRHLIYGQEIIDLLNQILSYESCPLCLNFNFTRSLLKYMHSHNPSARERCDTRSSFNGSLTGLKSEFSFYLVMLYNSYNLISVICLYTVCSIWPIDRTLSGATTPGQSGPRSNGNEGVHHIPEISKAGASPSDLFNVISRTLVDGALSLWRDIVSVFYSPSRLDCTRYDKTIL